MKSVLVVDDDSEILTVIADALACYGYSVLSAANGEDALRILGERRDIGLVLLDVQMPGLTGPEVVAMANRDERLRHIPFVLMTAALNMGPPKGILLLRKPFSLVDLLCLAVGHLGGMCPRDRSNEDCVHCGHGPGRTVWSSRTMVAKTDGGSV